MRICFLILLFAGFPVWADSGNHQGIHVSGSGTLEVTPDMGQIRLHARGEGSSAQVLKKELDDVVRAVLKIAADLDIASRDVTATAISINPRYRRRDNESVVDGLIATRTVAIILRDLDLFAELMNQSLAAGINNIDPIRLDTSRREALENEALGLAMADAEQEARRVADGFSINLGRVTNVILGSHSPRPQAAMMEMRTSADGGDFSPGVIRIERSLQATFAIDAAK